MTDYRRNHQLGSYACAGRSTKVLKTQKADVPMVWTGLITDADTPGDLLLIDGVTQLVLPKGFRPLYTWVKGSSGALETIDIGLAGGNQDALVAEGAADDTHLDVSGQDLGTTLTADTGVTYADGATPSTGGTMQVAIHGIMSYGTDDLFMK